MFNFCFLEVCFIMLNNGFWINIFNLLTPLCKYDDNKYPLIIYNNIETLSEFNNISVELNNHNIIEIIAVGKGGQSLDVNLIVIPFEFELLPVYPNPFNPTTKISYGLPEDGKVSLIVYNISGQEVAVLYDGEQQAGYHSMAWEASQYASGLYFLRLVGSETVKTEKMMLVK